MLTFPSFKNPFDWVADHWHATQETQSTPKPQEESGVIIDSKTTHLKQDGWFSWFGDSGDYTDTKVTLKDEPEFEVNIHGKDKSVDITLPGYLLKITDWSNTVTQKTIDIPSQTWFINSKLILDPGYVDPKDIADPALGISQQQLVGSPAEKTMVSWDDKDGPTRISIGDKQVILHTQKGLLTSIEVPTQSGSYKKIPINFYDKDHLSLDDWREVDQKKNDPPPVSNCGNCGWH